MRHGVRGVSIDNVAAARHLDCGFEVLRHQCDFLQCFCDVTERFIFEYDTGLRADWYIELASAIHTPNPVEASSIQVEHSRSPINGLGWTGCTGHIVVALVMLRVVVDEALMECRRRIPHRVVEFDELAVHVREYCPFRRQSKERGSATEERLVVGAPDPANTPFDLRNQPPFPPRPLQKRRTTFGHVQALSTFSTLPPQGTNASRPFEVWHGRGLEGSARGWRVAKPTAI